MATGTCRLPSLGIEMKIQFLIVALVMHLIGCQLSTLAIRDGAPLVEIERTTNLSAAINAIGGLPKSVHVEDVSIDGVVVIGKFRSNRSPYDWQVFEFQQGRGVRNLGAVANGYIAHGTIGSLRLNGNGSVIWGTLNVPGDGSHIFRHSRLETPKDLGSMGKKSLRVHGVSVDGSIVVGEYLHSLNEYNKPLYRAFRFSSSRGFEDLGAFSGESAFARGISPNGEAIAGNFQLADTTAHAFIHTPKDGTRDLGAIGGVAAFATDVTDDGSLAVGTYFGAFSAFRYTYDSHIFLYTKAGGVQSLKAMGGRAAGRPRLSLDGKKIVGSYIDDDESFLYVGAIRLP